MAQQEFTCYKINNPTQPKSNPSNLYVTSLTLSKQIVKQKSTKLADRIEVNSMYFKIPLYYG